MKIDFKKATAHPREFSVEKEGVVFSGIYKKENVKTVDIKGNIKNSILVTCRRCSKEFMIKLEESLHIKASDGIFKGNCEEADVIEFLDNKIDFDYILESEIESIKLDYHLCEDCKCIEDFEKEL
ncbi:hypothetical protein [Nitrosophilus alvini]|uniref:hypothetical protein n=1 Tax=Nitrosophilus alvini TaxID=2714855 RepID=UPI001909086C|nr:hypothetical protein [Nitrosophilus alvini]